MTCKYKMGKGKKEKKSAAATMRSRRLGGYRLPQNLKKKPITAQQQRERRGLLFILTKDGVEDQRIGSNRARKDSAHNGMLKKEWGNAD